RVLFRSGGPQIGAQLERLGIPENFVNGLRVTDDETMEIVEMVLGGTVNREIVGMVQRAGGRAAGLTGCDGSLLRVERKLMNGQDIGRVGHVVEVDPSAMEAISESGFVPVIAPIGLDSSGLTYNVNADEAAGAIAVALGAEKLVLLTDVEGVLDADGNRVSELSRKGALKYIDEQIIRGGMIPKVECCLNVLANGVPRAHIIDGRVLHAVLLEIFTDDSGVGTVFTA
ncbi:MAG: acetylglutamate kinase, partial [Myxococcota bacterium]